MLTALPSHGQTTSSKLHAGLTLHDSTLFKISFWTKQNYENVVLQRTDGAFTALKRANYAFTSGLRNVERRSVSRVTALSSDDLLHTTGHAVDQAVDRLDGDRFPFCALTLRQLPQILRTRRKFADSSTKDVPHVLDRV